MQDDSQGVYGDGKYLLPKHVDRLHLFFNEDYFSDMSGEELATHLVTNGYFSTGELAELASNPFALTAAILGSNDPGCRMDPCFKNETLETIFTVGAGIADAINVLWAEGRYALSVLGCGVGGAAGGVGGVVVGGGLLSIPAGAGGAIAGCIGGYYSVALFTAAYTPLNAAVDGLGVMSVFFADFFGDRTGWDPALNAYVIGGDSATSLTTATSGNTIGLLPRVGRGIARGQFLYDVYRSAGGATYEVRMQDSPGDSGIFGFWPASFSINPTP